MSAASNPHAGQPDQASSAFGGGAPAFILTPEIIAAQKQASVKRQSERTMGEVDRLPASVRAVVHDYGVGPVLLCWQAGVQKATTIADLIAKIRGYYADGRNANRGDKGAQKKHKCPHCGKHTGMFIP